MDLKHFSHNHALVFHQLPQGSNINCSGCKSPGSCKIYACWQCGHFLHEQCYHAKRFLDHPSHAIHPLTLVPYPTYPSGKFVCKSCNLEGNGMCYTCSKCQFDMHVHCALSPNSNVQVSSLPVRNDSHNYSNHLQTPIHPPYAANAQNFSLQSQNHPYPHTQNSVYPNFPHSGANYQNNHFRPPYTQHNTPTPNYYPPVNSPYPNPPPQHITGGSNNPSIQFPSYTQLNKPQLNSNPMNDARYQNPPPQPTSTNSTNNPPQSPPPYYPTTESQSNNYPPNSTQNFSSHTQNHAYPPTQNNGYPNFPHYVGTSGSNNQNNQFPPPYIQSITSMPNNSHSVNSPYPNTPTKPTTDINDTNKQNSHIHLPHSRPNTPTPMDNTMVNTPNPPLQPTGTSPPYSTEMTANTTTNDRPQAAPTPDHNPQISSPFPNPPPQHTTGDFNNQSIQFPSYTQTNNHPPNSNHTVDIPYPPPLSTPIDGTAVNSTSTTNNSPPPLHYPTAETQNSSNPQNVETSGSNNQNQFPPPHTNVYPSFPHNVGTDGSNNQNHFHPTHNNVYPSFPQNVGTGGSNNQNNQFPPHYIQSNIPMSNHNSPVNSTHPNPLPQPTSEINSSNEQNNKFPSPHSQPNTPTPNDNTIANAPTPNHPSHHVPTIPTYSSVTNSNTNTTNNNNPSQAPPAHNPQDNSPYLYPPPQYATSDLNNQSVKFPSHTQTNEQSSNYNHAVDAPYPYPPPKSTPPNSIAVNSITTTTNHIPPPPPPSHYPTAETQNSSNPQNIGTSDLNNQNHIPPSHNNVYSSFSHNVGTDVSNNQNNQFCPPYIQSNMPMPNHNSPVNSPYPNPPPQTTFRTDVPNEQTNEFPTPHPQPNTPTPNDNTTLNAIYHTHPPQHIPTIPNCSIVTNDTTATNSNNPPQAPPLYYTTAKPQTSNNPQFESPSIIQHFSHPHTLNQLEINKKSSKICSACDNKLSNSSFVCTEPHCSFNLHKACFDSPQEICHESHPSHTLKLVTTPKYEDGTFTCDACCKDGKGFAYSCATCSYDLHMNCVSLPKKMSQPDHKHALTLYYSSPVGKDGTLFCDVCNESVHESAWMYYCQRCDFGTHLECVESKIKPQNVISSVASDMDKLYATAISGRIAAGAQQAALDLWD